MRAYLAIVILGGCTFRAPTSAISEDAGFVAAPSHGAQVEVEPAPIEISEPIEKGDADVVESDADVADADVVDQGVDDSGEGCEGDRERCGNVCVDLQNDGANCGECFRDCSVLLGLLGECVDGECRAL
jgi:hypothetical protein